MTDRRTDTGRQQWSRLRIALRSKNEKKSDPLRHPILGAYGTSIVGMAPTVPPFASPSSMTCPTHTLLATTLELFITGTNIRSREQKFPGTFVLGSKSSQWSSRSENTGQWKVLIPSSWCVKLAELYNSFQLKNVTFYGSDPTYIFSVVRTSNSHPQDLHSYIKQLLTLINQWMCYKMTNQQYVFFKYPLK